MAENNRLTYKNHKGEWAVKCKRDCDVAIVYNADFGTYYIGTPIDRLAELEDAIESGELVRLPCKVGDTVYVIDQLVNSGEWVLSNDYTGWKYIVTDIYLNADRPPLFKITHRYGTEKLEDFGRTIFTDKAQAEAKLKELEGKK